MSIDGAAVRILRERTGISPGEFASRVGISEPYLRDIEGGRRKLKRDDQQLRFKIAAELDVPLRMVVIGD
jgi:transcriptional regulator with XRE-family HTH domain